MCVEHHATSLSEMAYTKSHSDSSFISIPNFVWSFAVSTFDPRLDYLARTDEKAGSTSSE
jgi:hypothetical protein